MKIKVRNPHQITTEQKKERKTSEGGWHFIFFAIFILTHYFFVCVYVYMYGGYMNRRVSTKKGAEKKYREQKNKNECNLL